jgi:membrane-bound lytic murein transglycosylase B
MLRQIHYVGNAVQLVKPAPPGQPKNWHAYRTRFIEPKRINAGAAFWEQHADALARAETQYGVPPEIIVGLPQFMPSNILKYAVDFDGDGHVDLRNSPADAIGSVASFLVGHGWQRDQPGAIVFPATVSPAREWERYADGSLEAKFRPEDLMSAGIVTTSSLPPGMPYGLVDLQNGSEPTEYWVASNNFYTITQYNRSYFYAMSVVELGRAIRFARQSIE